VGALLALATLVAVLSRAGSGAGAGAGGGEGRAPLATLGETKVGLETIVLPSGRKFELYMRRTDGGGKGVGVADVLLLHGRSLHSPTLREPFSVTVTLKRETPSVSHKKC